MDKKKDTGWSLPTIQVDTTLAQTKQRTRLGQLGRAVLIVCAILQTTSLLHGLYRNIVSNTDASVSVKRPIHTTQDAADEWEDNVWPIRQPTHWDISTDFPYPRKLEFDVDEGTWLRLDVHPTTGEIVFDLLGDIYCLPSEAYLHHLGSLSTRARPILTGIPHDSDPHFSPDGKLLAYRSDAELGIENIFVTEWKGCDSMDVRPEATSIGTRSIALLQALAVKDAEEEMLANGVQESPVRQSRRLLREGRLFAQRVTNETFRWLSDPRFHPSGSKIIATKWYFSQRSLGAGEGWEYELPTTKDLQIPIGSGKRLIGRSLPFGWGVEDYGEQQIGPEQFIWASEDSIIFSKNIRDVEGTFQYSKDAHSGIYAIFQRNLTTGFTTTLVQPSPGGASRPELSRDKATLAFVRRVRDKEALVLKDLRSGTLHNIWYGLTYDLSTIYSPMGTYPSFAFTSDDSAIIIWAAGKIWHVPLGTNEVGEKVGHGEPQVIPFRAHIEKRLAQTRSSKTDLLKLEAAETQRLHAFVDLSVNEEGNRVVFQGAGVNYYLDLDFVSSGKPRTGSKIPVLHPDSVYHSPSFIPGNSNLVIHSRWSDRNFSTFEVADLSTGKAIELSGLPLGRYTLPTLCGCSGNNRQIAFVKSGGDLLSGNVVATAAPGLYIGELTLPDFSAGGNEAISITNVRLVQPQFSTDGSIRFLEGNKKLLVNQYSRSYTIDLASGADAFGNYKKTTVASGLMAAEVSVSSKQDKVAFVDFFNVFVVDAKDANVLPVWSKPGNATKGLARVSLDGGHHIQWNGEGTRLFWLLGPYLHSLEVSKLSKCSSEIEGDAIRFGVDCVTNLLDVQEIDVRYPTDISRLSNDAFIEARARGVQTRNADVYAITNATLLTMAQGELERDLVNEATVIVRGGIIESVGHSDNIVIPAGATVLNAHGGFIIPGFIDVHAHWSGFGSTFPSKSWEMETFLAYGVTTLHNPSSDNVLGFVERGRIENGGMIGPRIFHTGDVIYGAQAPQIHNDVADVNDAHSALLRIKVEGGPASFSYKNYNQYSRASRQRLLLAARNLSMLCVPEGGMNQDWDITYIIDGMTTVEHALPIPTLYEDVLTLYALSGTGATPTHIVNYGGVMGEQHVWAHENIPFNSKLRRLARHDILESLAETTSRPKDSFAFFNTSASVAKMVKKGLRAHIGAHGEPPLGVIYHAEMEFTAAGGLDTFEVIRAATSDAAITLGIHDSVGTLSKGKLADLLIYPPGVNLLTDGIRSTRSLKYVVRGGRVWDASTMTEEWPKKGRKAHLPIINAD